MSISVRERPPLELHVELETPDGRTHKLHSAADDPTDRPQGLSFGTARFDGFKAGGFSLHRPINRQFNDLQLFNLARFISVTGDIAYEGQIAGLPRGTGTPPSWSVQLAGLMANARDRKFAMVFVDRGTNHWTAPLAERAQRKVVTLGQLLNDDYQAAADGGRLRIQGTSGKAIATGSSGEIMYAMPTGVNISRFTYQAVEANTTNVAAATLGTSDSPDFSPVTGTSLTLDDVLRSTVGLTPTRYATLSSSASSTHTPAAGSEHYRLFKQFAVYGDHGLTTQATSGPDGVLASDVVTWLIENYCPLLNAGGVQDTTYPIAQLAFHDRTHPYDAMLTVNSFHRWGLECWEGGTVHYGPLDLTDYDWELRLDDFGTALDVNGPVAEEVANGIEVTYTDVSTGRTTTLLPDDHEEIRDTNPLNPVNRAGRYKATDYTLNSPCTEEDALQIGRAALAEFNAPKHKGTATKQGYIKDRAGNEQPVHKVRAGDRVLITDSVDEEVHVVHETDYQHDRKEVRIAVDDDFQRLDAYLDRYANALQARGLAA
jgi:hypothetical protein